MDHEVEAVKISINLAHSVIFWPAPFEISAEISVESAVSAVAEVAPHGRDYAALPGLNFYEVFARVILLVPNYAEVGRDYFLVNLGGWGGVGDRVVGGDFLDWVGLSGLIVVLEMGLGEIFEDLNLRRWFLY